MGFFSDIDIEINEMVANGATRTMVANSYPMLREDEVDSYFGEADYTVSDADASDDEDDGQPTMYEEYQDLYGGDDSFDYPADPFENDVEY
jgi:hypothetical protein